MKRQEFINDLRKALANIPAGEREDILRDQEEYLHEAERAGRSEEEVIRALGDPKQLATRLNVEAKINSATRSPSLRSQLGRTLSAVFAILALAPFNLIFVLWPFIMVAALTFTAWIFIGGSAMCALASLFIFCFKLIFIKAGFWTHFSAFFFILGWIATSLLSIWAVFSFTRVIVKWTLRYLRWNLGFVSGRISHEN